MMVAPLLQRHLADSIAGLLDHFRVVVVTGARQVGKSTLARDVLQHRDGSYLTLDTPETLERALADPVGLAQSHTGTLTVIDEVQLAPELMRAVKLAVDRDERPGSFLLTGSANLLRMRSVSESLAGRAAYVELGPLLLTERLGLPASNHLERAFAASSAKEFVADVPVVEPETAPEIRRVLTSAVVSGGMPGTLAMDQGVLRQWYSAYLSTFVERDLWQLGRVDDVPAFRRLFSLAMLRSAGLLNRADLAADASLDHRTSSRYLDLLEVGYQLRTLTPYATNVGKRLTKMPKIHARDTGMAAHVMRVGSWDTAIQAGLAGQLFESWMISELLGIDALSGSASSAHFWRTSTGSEVDLVLERGMQVVGIEIKAGATVRWSDTSGLRGMRDALGSRFGLGIVAYLGDEVRVIDERICAIPAWTLLGAGPDAVLHVAETPAAYEAGPGAVLGATRQASGVRIAEIASLTGVDEATVEHWERTAYDDAPLSAVRAVAERLGVIVRLG